MAVEPGEDANGIPAAIRLGGALGNGARARGGGEDSRHAGCGADGDRAATLPERRVR